MTSIPTSRKAKFSLILALFGILQLGVQLFAFGLFTSGGRPGYSPSMRFGVIGSICELLAIILGAMAIREISKSRGTIGGQSLAIVGIVIGSIFFLMIFLYALFFAGLFFGSSY